MLVTWLCLVALIFACLSPDLSCALADSAENASLPHIHQHNGHMTSPNSSDIIREEGMYFLELLFTQYGTGSTMEISKLEKLLDNVGYISPEELEHGHHEDHGQEGEHSDREDHGQEGEHSDHEDQGQEAEQSDHFDLEDHDIHEEDHYGEDQSNEDHSKHEEHEENIVNKDHLKHEEEHGKQVRTKHEEIYENFTKHEEDHENGDHTKDDEDHGDHGDPERPSVNKEEYSDQEEDHSENERNGTDKDVHVDQRGNITEHEQKQKGNPSDGQTRRQKQNEGERKRNRKRKGKKKNHKKKHSNKDDEHNRKVRKHHKHEQKEILHEGHKHSIEGDDDNGNMSKKLVDKGHKGREHGGNLNTDPSVNRGAREHEVNSSEEHTGAGKQANERNNKNPSDNGRIGRRRGDWHNEQPMDSEKRGLDSDNEELENNHESVHMKKQESKKDRKHKNKKRRKGKKKGRKQKQESPSRDKRSTGHAIFHKHDIHAECMSIRELTEIFHFDKKTRISQKDFLYMSPAIIYQLDQPHCRRSSKTHAHEHKVAPKDISGRVWGYSSAAVLVISLVGLLGVAVIPIMQKVFYNQLLQFLVAMAVGALTGDAMLHLLPHAIADDESPDSGDGHNHSAAVWKGLSGLAGIYFFFIIQRILTIVSGVRSKRRGDKKSRVLESDIDRVVKRDVHASMGTSVPNRDIEQLQPLKVKEVEGEYSEGHSQGGHGHSHHDGSIPTSVSAVAWMVILGDGVHNFSDGLAIGAAFASSITGGFSTAIAVFCHELPHEIGDFAVLLKSGMSVKKAVFYNVVSSALCFLGMLIGVALGNIHEASTWIFAGVAGMFIYISLVTMIPELTSVNSNKPVRDLFLQCCGLCVGSGIMLTIAIYENELKTILD